MTREQVGPVVVLSRSWWTRDEPSFVLRSIAGALSRTGPVTVVTPGDWETPRPDGLFDVLAAGGSAGSGDWPPEPSFFWPCHPTGSIVVDATDREATSVAQGTAATASGGILLSVGEGAKIDPVAAGLPITVHPSAPERPHNGFGFTDYLLVLSDRTGDPQRPMAIGPPTAAASWLVARFPRAKTIVVEDAKAAAYWGRRLRGIVHVDTRTDLQRLMAHALLTVDLRPGRLIARECVESMLLGTPVVAPEPLAGTWLKATASTFTTVEGLLNVVAELQDLAIQRERAEHCAAAARSRFGDTAAFVAHLARVLENKGGPPTPQANRPAR